LETRRNGERDSGRSRRILAPPHSRLISEKKGFTLLEVLIAVAILGIAVSVVLQLFSADLRAISASEDYVAATSRAGAKMREILDDSSLAPKSASETTTDGYRIDVSVTEAMKERTENMQVALMDVSLTIRWIKGTKERSLTLRTMKTVQKQI